MIGAAPPGSQPIAAGGELNLLPSGVASTAAIGTPNVQRIPGIVLDNPGTQRTGAPYSAHASLTGYSSIPTTLEFDNGLGFIAVASAPGGATVTLTDLTLGLQNSVSGTAKTLQVRDTAFSPPALSNIVTYAVNDSINPNGIAPTSVLGAPGVLPTVGISPTGVVSTAGPGTPGVGVSIAALTPVGIAPTSGTGQLGIVAAGAIFPSGVAPASGTGTPGVAFGLTPAGIAPGSAPGLPAITEAVGISPTGIASTAALGVPGTARGAVNRSPTGIAPAAALGLPGISRAGAESADSTIVTTVGPAIFDANGIAYTITSGAQVAENGAPDTVTANVVEIAYSNHQVYHKNASGSWFVRQSPSFWEGPVAAPPLTAPPALITLLPSGIAGRSPQVGLPPLSSSLQRIVLNFPGDQTAGVPYTVNGNVDGYFVAPTLQLSTDDGASWIAIPADAIVTTSFYSFQRTSNNLGPHDYIVRDANNTAVHSATVTFNVVAPATAQGAFPSGVAPASGAGRPLVVATGVTQNIGASSVAPTSGVGSNIGQTFPSLQNIGAAAVAPASRVGTPAAGSNVLSIPTLATVISEFFNAQGVPASQNLSPNGIPSRFGGPGLPGVVQPADQTVTPIGAAPVSGTGLPGVFGAVPLSLLPSGIAPLSVVGAPATFRALTQGINPTGIASTATVGLETVGSRLPQIIAPFGFSTTLFGFPTVTPAPNQNIEAAGIAPTFAAGAFTTGDGFIRQAPPPDLIHAWRIAARRRAREMAEARDVEEAARAELARAKEEILSREYAALQDAIARIEAAQAVVARQQLMAAKAAEATQLMRKLEAARRKAEELQDEKDLEMLV